MKVVQDGGTSNLKPVIRWHVHNATELKPCDWLLRNNEVSVFVMV